MGLPAELLSSLGPYMSEDGGPGYKGDISVQTTNTYITKSIKVMVFPLKEGNNYYRIPTLIQLTNGDLLAFADKRIGSVGDVPKSPIETVYKKSTDNGKTWSQEKRISPQSTSKSLSYGDGAYCVDRKTGNIICLNVRKSDKLSPLYNHVLYTDDGGATWNVSKGAPVISKNPNRGGSEAKIVELNDGTLLMAISPKVFIKDSWQNLPIMARLGAKWNREAICLLQVLMGI